VGLSARLMLISFVGHHMDCMTIGDKYQLLNVVAMAVGQYLSIHF
jgi:hypothetical protein